MPIQSLGSAPQPRPISSGGLWPRRITLVVITVVATTLATLVLGRSLALNGATGLEVVEVVLFGSLFAWTSFSCASATAGFVASWREDQAVTGLRDQTPLTSRNAILAPVYNEPPGPVFARLEAMLESIEGAGASAQFDVFILSDTRDAVIAQIEQEGYERLCARCAGRGRIYYRRRASNVDRKAGNIAEWVRRFGGAYDHMIILDADSLMAGETLVRLAQAMETGPDIGLIQTVPTIVNGQTLFSRIEQFASRMYGPMFARGLEWWSGSESSYWGHNAILRVTAFAEQAGLPELAGPRPFGGSIMSHDFVEAALMRRAGWEVRLWPGLGGSYEESPPSLIDQIVRDRRWCQGNLQHIGVVGARGLHPLSRFHLLRGFSTYLTAPLWLGLLTIGLLLTIFPELGGSSAKASARFLTPALWSVFALSVTCLLLPKLMAWTLLLRQSRVAGFGGAGKALAGIGFETLVSSLIAPVVLFAQTVAVLQILCGRDAGWAAQRRDIDGLSIFDALRTHKGEAAFGLLLVVLSLAFEPVAFVWIAAPAIALMFAFLVSSWTARHVTEQTTLLTPERLAPPALLVRAQELQDNWRRALTRNDGTHPRPIIAPPTRPRRWRALNRPMTAKVSNA